MNRRWLIYLGAAVALLVAVELALDLFPRQNKDMRRALRDAVEAAFPQEAAEVAESFGLSRYGDATGVSPAAAGATSVVLIHGVDDPRRVWRSLAPTLASHQIDVWQMHYPNDQPIADSARFFYEEVKRLEARGVSRVVIVAHSMGGLVSREMLTNSDIGYAGSVRAGEVPQVVALIMVGTPNHGSEMARFRVFGELREQWIYLLEGHGQVLRGLLDGAGEAKIDLLPGSPFLQALNARPHPEGVEMLVIAGMVSPWDKANVDRLLRDTEQGAPAPEPHTLVDLEALMMSMQDGLGDGLVTVASTRLDGVEHKIVHGTHLTMIRNIAADSNRVPPAVPIIVDYLRTMRSQP